MATTYEILKEMIPELEKKYGPDSVCVKQFKQQQSDYEAEQEQGLSPETETFHAGLVPNPKDQI